MSAATFSHSEHEELSASPPASLSHYDEEEFSATDTLPDHSQSGRSASGTFPQYSQGPESATGSFSHRSQDSGIVTGSLSRHSQDRSSTIVTARRAPQVAVVLGAHTEVGKLVICDLSRCAQIRTIHALASVDPRDDTRIQPQLAHKLHLHIIDMDHIEEAVARIADRMDVAFCCLGSSRNDYVAYGAYEFHKHNYDIPRRFVREIFNRGVSRIAMLSQAGANSRSKVEFLRVKGDLIDAIQSMQIAGGRLAPTVGLFRAPLLLTNMKHQAGVKGTAISKRDRARQSAALKFDMGPARAVHVRDVATAMVYDSIINADKQPDSELTYQFRKPQYDMSELSGTDIVNTARQARAIQRGQISSRRVAPRTASHAMSQSARNSSHSRHENGSERFQHDVGDTASNFSGESGSHHNSQQNASQDDSFYGGSHQGNLDPYEQGLVVAPVGRIEYIKTSSRGGSSVGSDENDILPDEPITSQAAPMPIGLGGSVETLGQRLGRPHTRISGNELLPDVEDHRPKRTGRIQLQPEPLEEDIHYMPGSARSSPQRSEGTYEPVQVSSKERSGQEGASTFRSLQGSENSLSSPHSGMVDQEITDEYNPSEDPILRDYSHQASSQPISPLDSRYRLARSASLHSSIFDESEQGEVHHPSNVRYRRDLPRGRRDSRPIPPMERFSSLVRQFVAATDRSARRPRSAQRPQVQSLDSVVERVRGIRDTRAEGQTSI